MDYKEFNRKKSEITADLTAVAMGRLAGDLIMRNVRLVNVFLGRGRSCRLDRP